MNNETLVPFLQWVVAPLVLAVGTWFATKYTARNATLANAKTAEVAERATEVDGLDRLVGRLEKRLELQEQESAAMTEQIATLETKVRSLENSQREDKTMIRYLIQYAKTLRDTLIAARIPVPEAPAGINLDEMNY